MRMGYWPSRNAGVTRTTYQSSVCNALDRFKWLVGWGLEGRVLAEGFATWSGLWCCSQIGLYWRRRIRCRGTQQVMRIHDTEQCLSTRTVDPLVVDVRQSLSHLSLFSLMLGSYRSFSPWCGKGHILARVVDNRPGKLFQPTCFLQMIGDHRQMAHVSVFPDCWNAYKNELSWIFGQ